MVLDIIGNIDPLPQSFKENIPNNYRAMLTALHREMQVHMGLEYVYDVCSGCHLHYRFPHVDPQNPRATTECPECKVARFDAKGKPRRQAVYRSIADFLISYYAVAALAELARYQHDYKSRSCCSK